MMIEKLFGALSLAVFERRTDRLFSAIGPLPRWLSVHASPVDLTETFPLLEMFFFEWDENWEGHSDVWTEPGTDGAELYLQALATTLDGRRYLAIKSLPEAMFTYQQLAHDFELAKEKVERLSRELDVKRREAERATQAKSDFLAMMSHEIRTPLNAIIGMADVLSGTSLTTEQKKCVDIFQRNGVSLLTLINDILDLSKVEAGKIELEAVDFDLADVVGRAMEVVEGRASAKGLSLRMTIQPGVPNFLIGDPNRLRQIIINLLGNSIKFTDKGGLEVKVALDSETAGPGRLRFCIADTGIGIPADKVDLIFESFSQADSSTTRKYGGTGLGLSISKQFVQLMGGRIWVESELGVGSNFYFTAGFGVQEKQQPRADAATVSAATPEQQIAGMRILLADDSEDNRYLILSYLRNAQVKIDPAENGEQAAGMFRAGQYDVVLMDVEMPVMDGYQATRDIRQYERDKALNATPVLALTAHAFADMASKGFEAGFTDLLTKPIRKATLLEALAKYSGQERAVAAAASESTSVPTSTNIVEVEPGMEDVVPGYLAKRKAELPVYQAALDRADFDAIRKMAHKMKGTGSGYGFPMLTEIGAGLEKAAIDQQASQVREYLNQFDIYIGSIQLKYS